MTKHCQESIFIDAKKVIKSACLLIPKMNTLVLLIVFAIECGVVSKL